MKQLSLSIKNLSEKILDKCESLFIQSNVVGKRGFSCIKNESRGVPSGNPHQTMILHQNESLFDSSFVLYI